MSPKISPVILLAIQTALVFLQLVNAQLAVMQDVPGWVTLILSAALGAGTFFIQHVGNQQVPAAKAPKGLPQQAPKP